MDNETRRRRIAQRFLISVIQRYGREAPAVLREWADELEWLGRLHYKAVVRPAAKALDRQI